MTYTKFKEVLFAAIAEAAAANSRGQVDVFPVADHVLPGVSEQWVFDAVTSYEAENLVFNVSRRLGHPREGVGGIALMLTGKGREKAEWIKKNSSQSIAMEVGQINRTTIITG